jgi:hypothetical protein
MDSPVIHRTLTVQCLVRRHVTQPLGFGALGDRWSFVLLRHRTVRCHTGQSSAPLTRCSDSCCGTVLYYSSVRVDRWRELAVAPLAHQTVRWHTGQSGEL